MKKMRKVLTGYIFLIILGWSSIVLATIDETLNDITNHWAEKDINYLLQNEVIEGYEDGNFKPNQTIRLAEFLKILIKLSDVELEVKEKLWPDTYLATAQKNNWIDEEDLEKVEKNLTRYEVAKILGNYIGLTDLKKAQNKFIDLKQNQKEVILKLVPLGIITGYEDKTFRPEKEVTRAEACKMIKKAYEAKQELFKKRKYKLTSQVTNIGEISEEDSLILNRYEIKNNRIYIYDTGRYASLNAQTLNQEYIDDQMIIDILKVLVDDESYTELKFIPDKYIINSLNIFYGEKESAVSYGANSFQIRFYENAYYDVSKSKNEEIFIKDAGIKIKLGKMWKQLSEKDSVVAASNKNLNKLEAVLDVIFGNRYKKEIFDYIIEKRIEADKIPNTENPKIVEVKKFGKYTLNIWCIQNQELEIFIQKF